MIQERVVAACVTTPDPLKRAWRSTRKYRLWHMQPRGRLGDYYVEWNTTHDREAAVGSLHKRNDPLAVTKCALDTYTRWRETKDDGALDVFLSHAAYLRDSVDVEGTYPTLEAQTRHGTRLGYHSSAQAQSLAISVLVRAHQLRPAAGFLETALRAAEPMKRTIENGGVLWRSVQGDTFLEDVAILPPVHCLASGIIGCWGLFELERSAFVPWINSVVGPAVGTLQRRLRHYDAGAWSYESALVSRDGLRRMADYDTHDLHVALLRVFASMTGDRYFDRVACAWTRTVPSRGMHRCADAKLGLVNVSCRLAIDDGFAAGATTIF